MNTRSSSNDLVSPLSNPERIVRRNHRVDPSTLNNFKEINMSNLNQNVMPPPMGGDHVQGPPSAGPPPPNNGPPLLVRPNGPASDLRSMEEFCQPFINGRRRPIAPIPIQATDFRLRHHMIQQVPNSCQFHGLPGDDANKYLDKILEVTQLMKKNGVSDDALHLNLFPYSLTHHATAWYDRLSRNSIHSFDDMMKKFLSKYFPPSMDTSAERDKSTRSTTSSSLEIAALAKKMDDMSTVILIMSQSNQQVNVVNQSCETCGGPHHYMECQATSGHTQDVYAAQGDFPSNTVANPRCDLKAITTRSGIAYDGPMIPPTPSPIPKEVERKTEATKDKTNPKLTIPYPSRLNDQNLCEKANNQMMKFLQIFQRLHFDISFVNALFHMSKFASTFMSLLSNKEKLFELASTPLNENCLALILKKFLEKLGDPGKFLIPCDFPELEEFLALVDLGVSINLMPLSVWQKLSLPELTPTRMTLELAKRSVVKPIGVAEDVFVKVEQFYFSADFIIVDYDVRHTSRYSLNHYDETPHQVNVIDVACEEYAQEVLGFLDSSTSGNPTPSDPIIASSSPSFTPFEGSDFILEKIETFLCTPDELPNLDDDYYHTKGD
nr:reverse transcriptase domain-containing protein [Tanacetum cinerariifolium]